MFEWRRPEIIVVDLNEYEEVILASARSGGGGGGACGCWARGCDYTWY